MSVLTLSSHFVIIKDQSNHIDKYNKSDRKSGITPTFKIQANHAEGIPTKRRLCAPHQCQLQTLRVSPLSRIIRRTLLLTLLFFPPASI